jgi:hypothetical protein
MNPETFNADEGSVEQGAAKMIAEVGSIGELQTVIEQIEAQDPEFKVSLDAKELLRDFVLEGVPAMAHSKSLLRVFAHTYGLRDKVQELVAALPEPDKVAESDNPDAIKRQELRALEEARQADRID